MYYGKRDAALERIKHDAVFDRYALNVIYCALKGFETRRHYDTLRPFLPYYFKKIDNGFLPLNRDYKPLGMVRGRFVTYDDFDYLTIPTDEISTEISNSEWGYGQKTNGDLFAFSDASSPRDAKLIHRYKTVIVETVFWKFLGPRAPIVQQVLHK